MSDAFPNWIVALGTVLLDSLWQIALVGIVTAALLALLRNARSSVRYGVACVALIVTLALPLMQITRYLLIAAPGTASQAIDPVGVSPTYFFTSMVDLSDHATPWLHWVVAVWAVGVAVMALRMGLGLAWVQRLRRNAQPLLDAERLAGFARLARQVGVASRIDWLVADLPGGPLAAGAWRPFILVPTALLTRMPPAALEALIAHELAHLKRHDYLVNLLQSVIETVLFYHPAVWWLSRRIRIEREQAADELATRTSVSREQLAHALVELDGCHQQSLQWIQAAEGGALMSRIRNLVSPGAKPSRPMSGLAALSAIAILAAVLAQAQTPESSSAPTPVLPPEPPAAPDSPDAADVPDSPDQSAVRHVYRDFTYALVDGGKRDGFAMSGSLDDLDAIRAAQRSLTGKFVWFRKDNATYVIDDPKVVTQVEREFQQSRAQDAEMARLNAQMESHSKNIDALAARLDSLAGAAVHEDTEADAAAIEQLADRQAELAQRAADMAQRIASVSESEQARMAAEIDALEVERAKIDAQLRDREAALEAKVAIPASTQREIATLERQIETASEPLEPLSRQLDKLDTKQVKAFESADRSIRKLLVEARSQGLARPWPTRL